MTIPTASNSYSCFVRSPDDHCARNIVNENTDTCPSSGTRRSGIPSSVSSAAASSSTSRYHISSSSTHRLTCALISLILLLLLSAGSRASDPSDTSKYSFNGFAGGLMVMAGNEGEKPQESLLSKRSASEDDAIEELPSPSALRVEEKMAIMPEISLPTVTVRGFLNFRTTVDGTVIVFTPSSAAASASSAAAAASLTEGNTPTYMQTTSAMRMSSSHHNPFSYKTARASSSPVSSSATQWSSSYRPVVEIEATPVQSSSSAVYPTGVVTVIADSNTGENGMTTVQETKVIGTYIEGKYAQILKSSSYVSTPVIPSGTFAVYTPESSATKKIELRRPNLTRNSIHAPRFKDQRDRSEPVTRFTRGDRDQSVDGPTESTLSSESPTSRIKVRKPVGRLPGSGTGRFTWNRPASERVRLNRFKVKVAGDQPGSPSSRFTARDENDREAAKLLNQRLNRRLGISRAAPPENRSPAVVPDDAERDDNGENGDRIRSAGGYDLPLLEGMMGSVPAQSPDPEERKPHVVTDITTFTSEVTRGFAGGEPLIETLTHTSTIERTIEPTAVHTLDSQPASESVILASGMMQMIPDGLLFPSSLSHTPALPPPADTLVVARTFTLTDSSSRTSLFPSTDGSLTVTHTITENLVIRKLITAYKTIPGGQQNTRLYESITSEMDHSDYMEGLIGSENILNPSMFQGTLDLSITPTASGNNMRPTDLPLLHPSLNLGQMNNNNNNPLLNNANIGPQIDLNNPLVLGAALQNPGLAAMYFGLQQLSQQATQYTTIYKPTETLTTEVIYSTKTLSFYDGRQTRTRTITDPGVTTTKLVSTTIPDVQPVINPQVLVQQAQLQRAFASQLLHGQNGNNFNLNSMNLFASPSQQQQQQQQQQVNQNSNNNNNNLQQQLQLQRSQNPLLPALPQIRGSVVTESVTTVTSATATSTKIYTLIYNALSTKFRTVTSTSVFPTTVTELITKTITPSAAFNFFG